MELKERTIDLTRGRGYKRIIETRQSRRGGKRGIFAPVSRYQARRRSTSQAYTYTNQLARLFPVCPQQAKRDATRPKQTSQEKHDFAAAETDEPTDGQRENEIHIPRTKILDRQKKKKGKFCPSVSLLLKHRH